MWCVALGMPTTAKGSFTPSAPSAQGQHSGAWNAEEPPAAKAGAVCKASPRGPPGPLSAPPAAPAPLGQRQGGLATRPAGAGPHPPGALVELEGPPSRRPGLVSRPLRARPCSRPSESQETGGAQPRSPGSCRGGHRLPQPAVTRQRGTQPGVAPEPESPTARAARAAWVAADARTDTSRVGRRAHGRVSANPAPEGVPGRRVARALRSGHPARGRGPERNGKPRARSAQEVSRTPGGDALRPPVREIGALPAHAPPRADAPPPSREPTTRRGWV